MIIDVMIELMKTETFFAQRDYSAPSKRVVFNVDAMYPRVTNILRSTVAKKIPASVTALASCV